jgi:hypothetical protein
MNVVAGNSAASISPGRQRRGFFCPLKMARRMRRQAARSKAAQTTEVQRNAAVVNVDYRAG